MTEDGLWSMIRVARSAMDLSLDPNDVDADLANFPEAVRNVVCVLRCDSEVCNGGIHQFLYNHSGVLAPGAVTGLVAIGRLDLARLLQASMDKLGGEYPRDTEDRREIMYEMEELLSELRALDSDYFRLAGTPFEAAAEESLSDSVSRYVRENSE
ncbi:MAG: DUF4375 domain-containing protein [Phycisphaerales bacterium]